MFVRSLVIVCLLTFCMPAHANEDDAETKGLDALTSFSKLTNKTINSAGCLITGNVDFDAYQSKLAVIREAWLNQDYSVDFYRQRRKQVFTGLVLKRFAELLTEATYQSPPTEECSFSLTVSYSDKYGQAKEMNALKWKFNREIAGKINWQKFDPRDFHRVAADYRISPAALEWASDEPSMSGEKNGAEAKASCEMFLFRANAIFIRATTFCPKNYMDSRAGYAALAGAKACMPVPDVESKVKIAMSELDRIVKQRGRANACRWVEDVADQVNALGR